MGLTGDVPHIDEDTKRKILASTLPHLRKARSTGMPGLGAGAIYPVDEEQIVCDPFKLPQYWPRGFGLDVGWKRTAAIWGALDETSDILYLYAEHYMGQAPPSNHASAILARGEWIPGAIDPAARGRSQRDGEQLIVDYKELGLNLVPAKNAVHAGLDAVLDRLATGRLKVFRTCRNWFMEYRIYRRDEKGHIVKQYDHCLHPDTLVHSDRGLVPIRSLVGTAGLIRTIGGGWAAYHGCRMTAQEAPVVRVRFSDGSCVTCTPDHRFWTTQGWVEAQDMEGAACYKHVSQTIHRSSQCSHPPSSRPPSKSSTASAITSAVSIFSGMASAFTAPFGHRLMGGRCQKDSTCITGMKTSPTTIQGTCSSSQHRSISRTTSEGMTGLSLLKPFQLLLAGTAAMMAGIGTGSITRRTRRLFTSAARSLVSNAGEALLARSPARTAFARTLASPPSGASPASITSSVNAPSAGPALSSVDTRRLGSAADPAPLRCLAVEEAGRSDVYCMEVPGHHAFAVETGVAVHNCMDATRYLVVDVRKLAMTEVRASVVAKNLTADRTAGY